VPDLPAYTSASQLVTYASCPRKYEYVYVLGLQSEKKSLALSFGSAVHGAIGWWFAERLEGRSPSVADAEQIFAADLAADVESSNTTPEVQEAEAQGRLLVRMYLERHGELPVAAVEQPFEISIHDPITGEVLPRRLRGYFDLVLEDGRVIEIKTSARSWGRTADLRRHLQVNAYGFATGGVVEAHVLVKKKDPSIEVFRSEQNNNWWLAGAVSLERAILSGIFPPTPSVMCSTCDFEKNCAAFADGGRVHLPIVARAAV
jgi:putative RecB family exonuclease